MNKNQIQALKDIDRALGNKPVWVVSDTGGFPRCGTDRHIPASHSDPSTWSTLDVVLETCKKVPRGLPGLAVGSGVVALDLDDCLGPHGEVTEFAEEILSEFDTTYIERSRSGTGIHVILISELEPRKGRKRPEIEMYSRKRFIALTGDSMGYGRVPSNCDAQLARLYSEYECLTDAEYHSIATEYGMSPKDVVNGTATASYEGADDTVRLIQDAIYTARNGSEIGQLWHGRWHGLYPSQSEADLALCCHIVFYAGEDATVDHIKAVFAQSGLYGSRPYMRVPKWDRIDYSTDTVREAMKATISYYTVVDVEQKKKDIESLTLHLANLSEARTETVQIMPLVEVVQGLDFRKMEDITIAFQYVIARDFAARKPLVIDSVTGEWLLRNETGYKVADRIFAVKYACAVAWEVCEAKVKSIRPGSMDDKEYQKFVSSTENIFRSDTTNKQNNHYSALLAAQDIITVSVNSRSHVNFPNGVLDLSDIDGEGPVFRSHTELDNSIVFDYVMPFEYSPTAKCPNFEKFVLEVTAVRQGAEFKESDRAVKSLQAVSGKALHPRGHLIEKMGWLLGAGGNGKSTLIRAITSALGPLCKKIDFTMLDKPFYVSSIGQPWLIYSDEQPERFGSVWQSAMRYIVSGESVMAEKKYGKSYNLRILSSALWAMNSLPVSTEAAANLRRVVLYRFDRDYTNGTADFGLKDRLLTERAGIFNWLLAGAVSISKSVAHPYRIEQLPEYADTIEDSKVSSNSAYAFVSERYTIQPHGELSAKNPTVTDAFKEYRDYCVDNENKPMSRHRFSQELVKMSVEKDKKSGYFRFGLEPKFDKVPLNAPNFVVRDS